MILRAAMKKPTPRRASPLDFGLFATALYLRCMSHDNYMLRCLELARLGLGFTRTNPLVGALVVHQDTIIGEGYHANYGGPHAEVHAIAAVKDKALLKTSTLYVNLEPCSHFGKTPPCSDLILQHGIPKVVYGMEDPFDLVAGRGLNKLREHGVEVIGPVLEKECKTLNKRFLCGIRSRRPYIVLKWAQSTDGFMDIERSGHEVGSYAISGPAAQALVHQWRTQESAILIGVQTAINDRPQLNIRYASGPQPLRIVVDPHGRLPQDHPMRHDGLPLLVIQEGDPTKSTTQVLYVAPPFDLHSLLEPLLERGIGSILIEGGQRTLQSWLNANLWDEARILSSPITLDKGLAAPALNRKPTEFYSVGPDICNIYHPE